MSENQSLPEGSEFDMTSTTFETNESETIAEVQKGGTALQSTLATTQIHYLSVNNDPQIIAEEAQSTETDQVEPIKFVDKLTSSQTHEDLPTFELGCDHAAISTRWSRWLEVWELYLASKELDKIENGSTEDYERSKILKPLFLLKIGEEAREVYNSKRKTDKSDKLTEIIKFMSDHYAPKRSVFAFVSIFYKAKRHEGELVSDYVVRLRQLAKPCNFDNSLDNELLRAFVLGCGSTKVEELMCSNDSKTRLTVASRMSTVWMISNTYDQHTHESRLRPAESH